MASIARVNTERNKRRSCQMFLNFFWVHVFHFTRSAPISQCRSRRWWLAEMGGMGGVGGEVVEHRFNRGRDWLELRETGEDRAIADLAVDHKGRTLGDFERVKFGRARAGAGFYFR